jgi:hypothetical protein
MSKRIRNDGKQLEDVISFIEGLQLPSGWTVTPRKLMPGRVGRTVAELDIVISGRVGTMDFSWLIECRDRPASGKAPASWIEQLVTRKARYNFSRVTAVSTTGFSSGATELAEDSHIDLREFKRLTPSEFSNWPELTHMPHRTDIVLLNSAMFEFDQFDSPALEKAINDKLATPGGGSTLRSVLTNDLITTHSIFTKIMDRNPSILGGLEVNGPALPVRFRANLKGESSYVLETELGAATVASVLFEGSVQRTEELKPLAVSGEYLRSLGREPISRLRTFEPYNILGVELQAEIHDFPSDGGATIVLRCITGKEA